jgi:hypothetical protein
MTRVIRTKVGSLGLGAPIYVGPQFMPRARFGDMAAGDRIRTGAVWIIGGHNCGFHVDFCENGQVHIEAWTGKLRKISIWICTATTVDTLRKDLTVSLVAAGLTGLARKRQ